MRTTQQFNSERNDFVVYRFKEGIDYTGLANITLFPELNTRL